MAAAQSPDVPTLRTYLNDCAAQYLRRLQWLIDLRADPVRRQKMVDVLTAMGWTEDDIVNVATPLRQAAVALQNAPRANYAQIITACDALLADVNAPDSLWPE